MKVACLVLMASLACTAKDKVSDADKLKIREAQIATQKAMVAESQRREQLEIQILMDAQYVDAQAIRQQAQRTEAAVIEAAGKVAECEVDPQTADCKPKDKK